MFGQDAQFIKRLETISNMNLIYAETYLDWSKKFKDIRDVVDAEAQAASNSLSDKLSDRRYKELKAEIPEAKRIIGDYESKVDALDASLHNKFRDEDECRQLVSGQKEAFRSVKQDYYSIQSDMSLLTDTFDAFFRKLDSLFESADQDIDNARYAEAKTTLLARIAPVISQISKVLKTLPNICLQIQSVIPDKLSSLESHYEELTAQGYPLYHLLTKTTATEMRSELLDIASKVKSFELAGVEEELDQMLQRLDSFNEAFDKEKRAREVFEKECNGIVESEKGLEQSFISLCHAWPKIKTIYFLGGDDQAKVDEIQKLINKAGASKRSLDACRHSLTQQPYSILVERMYSLRDQASDASLAMNSFQEYLKSLKSDSEAAALALKTYTLRLRDAEKLIHDINLEAVTKKYAPSLEAIYVTLDSLKEDLRKDPLNPSPIDVKKVKADLSALTSSGDLLFSDLLSMSEELSRAENSIVFANRHRSLSAEVNSALVQAEALFYKGEFKAAYDIAEKSSAPFKEDE